MKPIVAFSNLAKALKKNQHISHQISSLDLNISQVHSVNFITNFVSTIASHPLFGLHSGCFQTHFPVEIPVSPPKPLYPSCYYLRNSITTSSRGANYGT